eukprot:jgi/Ulvmu1/9146/UM005_0244.1
MSALLSRDLPQDVTNVIVRDVPRSFPEFEYFQCQDGKLHLRQVLHAYAACDPGVGYCQGLNFLAGCILLYCPDAEEAFQVLYALLVHKGMRNLYLPDLKVLQSSMDSVMGCLPASLQAHFLNCGVVRSMFLPSWLMTVFSGDFHISITGRLLDIMLVEGWRRPLLATATTFITVSQPCLEQMKRMESMVEVLKVQLPALPIPKHHQIISVALQMAWPDEGAELASGSVTQQAGCIAPRRHSLMLATPNHSRTGINPIRRATADLPVHHRQRKGSTGPLQLPTSYGADDATAMKQKIEQLVRATEDE